MMISIALPRGALAFTMTADKISRLENALWPIALFLLMMAILLGVLFVTGRDTPRRYRASKATAFERYERWLSESNDDELTRIGSADSAAPR